MTIGIVERDIKPLYSNNKNHVDFLVVRFEVLRPSQQLWSCRDCQFT